MTIIIRFLLPLVDCGRTQRPFAFGAGICVGRELVYQLAFDADKTLPKLASHFFLLPFLSTLTLFSLSPQSGHFRLLGLKMRLCRLHSLALILPYLLRGQLSQAQDPKFSIIKQLQHGSSRGVIFDPKQVRWAILPITSSQLPLTMSSLVIGLPHETQMSLFTFLPPSDCFRQHAGQQKNQEQNYPYGFWHKRLLPADSDTFFSNTSCVFSFAKSSGYDAGNMPAFMASF